MFFGKSQFRFFFTFLARFLPIFVKSAFLCRKMQNFCVVLSMFCDKCEKNLKISSKISLTCAVGLCIILGTPTRCSPKGWAAPREQAKQGRARQFSSLQTFWGVKLSWEARYRIQPSGWGAGEEKEREGKGRDACRGLRRDEVLRNFGARLHGTDESEKDSLVQQFLK